MTKMDKLEALENAFNKIQIFCISNYRDVFVEEKKFHTGFNSYVMTYINVMPNGTVYLTREDHGGNKDYVFHPSKGTCLAHIATKALEDVVVNWAVLKEKMNTAKEKELSIYNFEV